MGAKRFGTVLVTEENINKMVPLATGEENTDSTVIVGFVNHNDVAVRVSLAYAKSPIDDDDNGDGDGGDNGDGDGDDNGDGDDGDTVNVCIPCQMNNPPEEEPEEPVEEPEDPGEENPTDPEEPGEENPEEPGEEEPENPVSPIVPEWMGRDEFILVNRTVLPGETFMFQGIALEAGYTLFVSSDTVGTSMIAYGFQEFI